MDNFVFVGLISLIDPPTAAAIARQVNIIPKSVKTNVEIMEEEPNLTWDEAAEKCKAIVVHGDKIVKSLDKEIIEGLPPFTYLRNWVNKPFCVFARTTPA